MDGVQVGGDEPRLPCGGQCRRDSDDGRAGGGEADVDAPLRLPDNATDVTPLLVANTPQTAEVVVRYVSGMTDRYALASGVELLGWRPDALPRGV